MLIRDLPIGAILEFGTIRRDTLQWLPGVQNEYVPIRWVKVSDACDFMTIRNVNKNMVFDWFERSNPESSRANGGNNLFSASNLLQWLNASGPGWFHPTHQWDELYYGNHDEGFLTGFDGWEKDQLVPVERDTLVPMGERRAFGRVMKVKSRVSIPSIAEVSGRYAPDYKTGESQFPFFENGGRIDFNFVTRTPYNDSKKMICTYRRNSYSSTDAASSVQVSPLIRLKGDTNVDLVETGVYIMQQSGLDLEGLMDLFAAL